MLLLVLRDPSGAVNTETVSADTRVGIATAEEVEQARTRRENALFVANLRILASWFEEHPDLPRPWISPMAHLHGDDGVERVRKVAERLGTKVCDDLDDRTETRVNVGVFEYAVIAWHRDGRPGGEAEPADPDHGRTTAALQPQPGMELQALGRAAQGEVAS
jgi:hypothetical protein